MNEMPRSLIVLYLQSCICSCTSTMWKGSFCQACKPAPQMPLPKLVLMNLYCWARTGIVNMIECMKDFFDIQSDPNQNKLIWVDKSFQICCMNCHTFYPTMNICYVIFALPKDYCAEFFGCNVPIHWNMHVTFMETTQNLYIALIIFRAMLIPALKDPKMHYAGALHKMLGGLKHN